MKTITVKELKEILNKYDENLPVAFRMFSEYALLEESELEIKELQPPREDGWVHDKRPDKPYIQYLVFPGN